MSDKAIDGVQIPGTLKELVLVSRPILMAPQLIPSGVQPYSGWQHQEAVLTIKLTVEKTGPYRKTPVGTLLLPVRKRDDAKDETPTEYEISKNGISAVSAELTWKLQNTEVVETVWRKNSDAVGFDFRSKVAISLTASDSESATCRVVRGYFQVGWPNNNSVKFISPKGPETLPGRLWPTFYVHHIRGFALTPEGTYVRGWLPISVPVDKARAAVPMGSKVDGEGILAYLLAPSKAADPASLITGESHEWRLFPEIFAPGHRRAGWGNWEDDYQKFKASSGSIPKDSEYNSSVQDAADKYYLRSERRWLWTDNKFDDDDSKVRTAGGFIVGAGCEFQQVAGDSSKTGGYIESVTVMDARDAGPREIAVFAWDPGSSGGDNVYSDDTTFGFDFIAANPGMVAVLGDSASSEVTYRPTHLTASYQQRPKAKRPDKKLVHLYWRTRLALDIPQPAVLRTDRPAWAYRDDTDPQGRRIDALNKRAKSHSAITSSFAGTWTLGLAHRQSFDELDVPTTRLPNPKEQPAADSGYENRSYRRWTRIRQGWLAAEYSRLELTKEPEPSTASMQRGQFLAGAVGALDVGEFLAAHTAGGDQPFGGALKIQPQAGSSVSLAINDVAGWIWRSKSEPRTRPWSDIATRSGVQAVIAVDRFIAAYEAFVDKNQLDVTFTIRDPLAIFTTAPVLYAEAFAPASQGDAAMTLRQTPPSLISIARLAPPSPGAPALSAQEVDRRLKEFMRPGIMVSTRDDAPPTPFVREISLMYNGASRTCDVQLQLTPKDATLTLWRTTPGYGVVSVMPPPASPAASGYLDQTRGLMPFSLPAGAGLLFDKWGAPRLDDTNDFEPVLDSTTVIEPSGKGVLLHPAAPPQYFQSRMAHLQLETAPASSGGAVGHKPIWRYQNTPTTLRPVWCEMTVEGRSSLDGIAIDTVTPIELTHVEDDNAFTLGVPDGTVTGWIHKSPENMGGKIKATQLGWSVRDDAPYVKLRLDDVPAADGAPMEIAFTETRNTAGLGSDDSIFVRLETDSAAAGSNWKIRLSSIAPVSPTVSDRNWRVRDGGHPLIVDLGPGFGVSTFDTAGVRLDYRPGRDTAFVALVKGTRVSGTIRTGVVDFTLVKPVGAAADLRVTFSGALDTVTADADLPHQAGLEGLECAWALTSLTGDIRFARFASLFYIAATRLLRAEPTRMVVRARLSHVQPGSADENLADGEVDIVLEPGLSAATPPVWLGRLENAGPIQWRFERPKEVASGLTGLTFRITAMPGATSFTLSIERVGFVLDGIGVALERAALQNPEISISPAALGGGLALAFKTVPNLTINGQTLSFDFQARLNADPAAAPMLTGTWQWSGTDNAYEWTIRRSVAMGVSDALTLQVALKAQGGAIPLLDVAMTPQSGGLDLWLAKTAAPGVVKTTNALFDDLTFEVLGVAAICFAPTPTAHGILPMIQPDFEMLMRTRAGLKDQPPLAARMSSEWDKNSLRLSCELTGSFVLRNRLKYIRQETDGWNINPIQHDVTLTVDRARIPLESLLLGRMSANAPAVIAGWAAHTWTRVRPADARRGIQAAVETLWRWESPQCVQFDSMKRARQSRPGAFDKADPDNLLVIDFGAVFWVGRDGPVTADPELTAVDERADVNAGTFTISIRQRAERRFQAFQQVRVPALASLADPKMKPIELADGAVQIERRPVVKPLLPTAQTQQGFSLLARSQAASEIDSPTLDARLRNNPGEATDWMTPAFASKDGHSTTWFPLGPIDDFSKFTPPAPTDSVIACLALTTPRLDRDENAPTLVALDLSVRTRAETVKPFDDESRMFDIVVFDRTKKQLRLLDRIAYSGTSEAELRAAAGRVLTQYRWPDAAFIVLAGFPEDTSTTAVPSVSLLTQVPRNLGFVPQPTPLTTAHQSGLDAGQRVALSVDATMELVTYGAWPVHPDNVPLDDPRHASREPEKSWPALRMRNAIWRKSKTDGPAQLSPAVAAQLEATDGRQQAFVVTKRDKTRFVSRRPDGTPYPRPSGAYPRLDFAAAIAAHPLPGAKEGQTWQTIVTPSFDVVSSQLRVGAPVTTHWSVGLAATYGSDHVAPYTVFANGPGTTLRRPRGRPGPGEMISLEMRPEATGPVLSGTAVSHAMTAKQSLGETRPGAAGVLSSYFVLSDTVKIAQSMADKSLAQQEPFILPLGLPASDQPPTSFRLPGGLGVSWIVSTAASSTTDEPGTGGIQIVLTRDPMIDGINKWPSTPKMDGLPVYQEPLSPESARNFLAAVLSAPTSALNPESPGRWTKLGIFNNTLNVFAAEESAVAARFVQILQELRNKPKTDDINEPAPREDQSLFGDLRRSGAWIGLAHITAKPDGSCEASPIGSFMRIQIVDSDKVLQPNGLAVALMTWDAVDQANKPDKTRLSGYTILPNSSFTRVSPGLRKYVTSGAPDDKIAWRRSADLIAIEPTMPTVNDGGESGRRFEIVAYGPAGEQLVREQSNVI